MAECIFCQIADGKAKAEVLHRDSDLVAFRDIRPQAPVHALIVPRRHIAQLNDISNGDAGLLGKAVVLAADLARKLGVQDGYRLVINNGASAGQSVWHLHWHLLGGRAFSWPPG